MYSKKEEVVIRIFDKLSEEFDNNPQIIFKSNSEKSRMKNDLDKKRERMWRSSNKCLFYNCEKQSIKYSHTLQKSGTLRYIADNNHLYTPRYDGKSGKITIKKISINYASTFPGFCKEHEVIFFGYERKKNLSADHDIVLQIYRTITREIFVIKHHLTCLKDELNSYIKFRNQRFKEILEEELKINEVSDINIINLKFDNIDTYEILCNQKIDELSNILIVLEEFYSRLNNVLDGFEDTNTVSFIVINIDIVIPVALSGMGNFGITQSNVYHDVVCMLNVIPQEKNTLLFMVALEEYSDSLKFYINSFGQNGYISYKNFIEMVESWMVYGTDNWFINPSKWNEIDDANKEMILHEIGDTEKNISNKFSGDIFKNLKLYVENMEMKYKQKIKNDNFAWTDRQR